MVREPRLTGCSPKRPPSRTLARRRPWLRTLALKWTVAAHVRQESSGRTNTSSRSIPFTRRRYTWPVIPP